MSGALDENPSLWRSDPTLRSYTVWTVEGMHRHIMAADLGNLRIISPLTGSWSWSWSWTKLGYLARSCFVRHLERPLSQTVELCDGDKYTLAIDVPPDCVIVPAPSHRFIDLLSKIRD
ncbi:hypothetical protein E4U53_000008 [Claviceps sorghi]|nr:hypothetical protein E4U53_000008 [Claviceps sorghi]